MHEIIIDSDGPIIKKFHLYPNAFEWKAFVEVHGEE